MKEDYIFSNTKADNFKFNCCNGLACLVPSDNLRDDFKLWLRQHLVKYVKPKFSHSNLFKKINKWLEKFSVCVKNFFTSNNFSKNTKGTILNYWFTLIFKHLYKWLLKKLLNILIITPSANHWNNWIISQNSSYDKKILCQMATPINSWKAWNSE